MQVGRVISAIRCRASLPASLFPLVGMMLMDKLMLMVKLMLMLMLMLIYRGETAE